MNTTGYFLPAQQYNTVVTLYDKVTKTPIEILAMESYEAYRKARAFLGLKPWEELNKIAKENEIERTQALINLITGSNEG